MRHLKVIDNLINDGLWDAFHDYLIGITAENVANRFNISREEQDEFALKNRKKTGKAIKIRNTLSL